MCDSKIGICLGIDLPRTVLITKFGVGIGFFNLLEFLSNLFLAFHPHIDKFSFTSIVTLQVISHDPRYSSFLCTLQTLSTLSSLVSIFCLFLPQDILLPSLPNSFLILNPRKQLQKKERLSFTDGGPRTLCWNKSSQVRFYDIELILTSIILSLFTEDF